MSCVISKDKHQNSLNEIGTKTYYWVRIGQINRNIKTGSLVWNSKGCHSLKIKSYINHSNNI